MNSVLERHLYVAWRHPEGSIIPIGLLVQRVCNDTQSFEFSYLKRAEQLGPRFEPLPGLLDLNKRYESSHIFPVFATRQMPRERPDYDAFVQQLNLSADADPFEVLTRSEGHRATDRIEVFAAPSVVDGSLTALFFARGIRHLEGASEAIEALNAGEQLRLEPEPSNPVNERALLLNSRTGSRVGYAPDYLVQTIHELLEFSESEVRVVVEHANPATSAAHMRLLCRLEAPCPDDYEPLSGPDFLLLS